MNEPLIQLETCKTCGMPYGSPDPEAAQSRSYCQRCSNLPQNVLAVLELHYQQLRRKAEEIREKEADSTATKSEPVGKQQPGT